MTANWTFGSLHWNMSTWSSGPFRWNHSMWRTLWNGSSWWNMTDLDDLEMEDFDDSDETISSGPQIFSSSLLLSFTISFALLVTVGLLGNTMVIFALFRTRAHRATTTNAYILNLSIADLLFLIFCVPFQGTVYILNDWPYGDFMCKAAHYCQSLTMYSSIWLLAVMSVDRYLAIGHPLKSVDWRSPGQATRICCYVWLTSAILSIPWWLLYRTETLKSSSGIATACFDYWGRGMYEYRKWLFLFVFLTGFVLPSCVIFCMALLVARSIKSAVDQPLFTENGRHSGRGSRSSVRMAYSGLGHGGTVSKRRRRVVWLVFGLALTFFLCWLPHNASFMWLNFHTDIANSFQRHYIIYFIIKVASHMLTYVNSSINPILYSLASGRFRSRLSHALFMKNAAAFNYRAGNGSRHRSTPVNRHFVLSNGSAGALGTREPGEYNRNTGRRGYVLHPLLRQSPSNYRRTTESDFASTTPTRTTPSRTSSWGRTGSCGSWSRVGRGSGGTDDQPSPNHFRPRHLSDMGSSRPPVPPRQQDTVSLERPTPLHRLAATNRQRALTWSSVVRNDTACRENGDNCIVRNSTTTTKYGNGKQSDTMNKRPPWRKRFQLFWRA